MTTETFGMILGPNNARYRWMSVVSGSTSFVVFPTHPNNARYRWMSVVSNAIEQKLENLRVSFERAIDTIQLAASESAKRRVDH